MISNIKNPENKLNIGSGLLLCFLLYILLIWMFDVIDLCAFLLGMKQVTVISRVFILIIWCIIILFIKPKINVLKIEFNSISCLSLIIIITLGFLKGLMPDLSYDTGNYHLLAQEPGFINYFTEHFALGNFQVWGFRLSDRLAYLFRKILGYRMGTLFSSVILSISYFQVVQILKQIRKDINMKKQEPISNCWFLSPDFFGLLIILGQDCLTSFGSYYVDVYAFPIAFEVLRLLMKARNNKISNIEVMYYALLNGVWIAFKMTNIVFIIPAIILFIIFVKKIDIKTFVASGLLCILPVSIYLIFNYACTDNPIFPYFNTLFQSDYFGTNDFKDVRWGGQNIFEKLFWIFFAVFRPDYRQCEISNQYTTLYIGGLISSLGILGYTFLVKLKKIEYKGLLHIELVTFVSISSILWGLTTGIQRYFSFGMLVLAIVCYEGLLLLSRKLKKEIPIYIIVSLFSVVTIIQIRYVIAGREWSWRQLTYDEVRNNVKYLFCDQKYQGTLDLNKIDGFAIMNCEMGGIAHWIYPDAYVYNLDYENKLSEIKKEQFTEKKNELMNNNLYDLQLINFNVDEYEERLNERGLQIIDSETISTNIGLFNLFKLSLKN